MAIPSPQVLMNRMRQYAPQVGVSVQGQLPGGGQYGFAGGTGTPDNRITNQMVGEGALPPNQAEIYPQQGGMMSNEEIRQIVEDEIRRQVREQYQGQPVGQGAGQMVGGRMSDLDRKRMQQMRGVGPQTEEERADFQRWWAKQPRRMDSIVGRELEDMQGLHQAWRMQYGQPTMPQEQPLPPRPGIPTPKQSPEAGLQQFVEKFGLMTPRPNVGRVIPPVQNRLIR